MVKSFRGIFPKSESEARCGSSYDRHSYFIGPGSSREHQYTELQVLSKQNGSVRIPVNPTVKTNLCSDMKIGGRLSIVREFGHGSDLRRSVDRNDGLNVWTLDAGRGRTKRYGDNSKRTICTSAANSTPKTTNTGHCAARTPKNKVDMKEGKMTLGPMTESIEAVHPKNEEVHHIGDETHASPQIQEAREAHKASMEEQLSFEEMLTTVHGPRCKSSNR